MTTTGTGFPPRTRCTPLTARSSTERHVHGFMNGVIAISGGEFAITDIEEDTSQVDYDKERGKQILSFKYNGKPYTFEAEFYGDWLDCDVVGFMNDVFAAEGIPNAFWPRTTAARALHPVLQWRWGKGAGGADGHGTGHTILVEVRRSAV